MEKLTAVLAGTPVDTQMGVDCLEAAGLPALACPLSPDPRGQMAFQNSPKEEKNANTRKILTDAKAKGCSRAFIYCNSLSASVEFPPLAQELSMRIVTPLDVYRELANSYKRLSAIAANAQGVAGIERVMLLENPKLDLISIGMLQLVESIEAKMDPDQLVAHHRLPELAGWLQQLGMEALVLGCTHYPYFKEALARRTTLPLIDPAQRMIELLVA